MRVAGIGQCGEPVGAPCESVAEFLGDVRTAVAEHNRVNGQHSECGNIGSKLNHSLCGFDKVCGYFAAVAECAAQRVEVNRATEAFFCSLFLNISYKIFNRSFCFTLAAVDIDFDFAEVDAFEQNSDFLFGGFGEFETERGHTLGEYIAGDFICLCSRVGDNFLTGEPVVVVAGTAYVGIFTGERIGGFEAFDVFEAVNRLKVEAFVCAPHELLVEVGALEVSFHFCTPFLIGSGGKLIE